MSDPVAITESTTSSVISMILNGDAKSVMGILILAVMFLFYDRIRLIKEIKQRDTEERTDRGALIELIEKHHRSSLETNQALNMLMIVLTRIEAKTSRNG